MYVFDAISSMFWTSDAYDQDMDLRAERGSADLEAEKMEGGMGFNPSNTDSVRDSTGNPADAMNRVARSAAGEPIDLSNTSFKLPKGKEAFFDRHPVLRLLLGGAILTIASAVFLGGGVLAGTAVAFLPGLLGLTGFAAVVTGIAIGLAVFSATWVVVKTVGEPAFSMASTAVDDIVEWRRMKNHLKEFKAPKADIELAHKHFYSSSPLPVEILIRNDTVLTARQKHELFKMSREDEADRSVLFDHYQIARQVREAELRRERVPTPLVNDGSENELEFPPFPDRFILYVSGSDEAAK